MNDFNYCFLIKRIWGRATKCADAKLKPLGITVAQAIAIEYISDSKVPVTQSMLEKHMEIRHSAVVGIVSRLEEKGLLTAEAGKDDRRQKFLRPTELTGKIRSDINKVQREIEGELTKGFSLNEIGRFEEILMRVYKNLDY